MDIRVLFGINVLLSFVASGAAAYLFIWPRLRDLDRREALILLVAPHMFFRFIGISFLIPGVVSPSLPAAFAVPAAYGDLIAGILAIAATVALVWRATWAIGLVWIFNVWGTADLLFAFYQGAIGIQIDIGMLGASYFIPTAIVPPLLVTHFLIFLLLIRRKRAQ